MVNKGVGLEMFEAIIYNISVMVAGIYLFHRLQYSENKKMVFSKEYVTVLMTLVSLLLAAYPIPFKSEYLVHLTFVPLLFLGRYTNMIYTLASAFIVALVDVLIFGNSIIYGITLVVIAGVVSAVGPFLKQYDKPFERDEHGKHVKAEVFEGISDFHKRVKDEFAANGVLLQLRLEMSVHENRYD